MTLLMFVIGACLGSFLNVVLSRDDWYIGRSHCESCNYTLQWFDLIPVVSYLLYRGRCRKCGKKIDVLHLASEVYMGCGFAAVGMYCTTDIMTAITLLVAVTFLCICAICDSKDMEISVLFLYGGIVSVAVLKMFHLCLCGEWIDLIKFIIIYGIVYLIFVFVSIFCKNHVGEGDFDILMIMLLAAGLYHTAVSVTIASVIGLCVYLPLLVTKRITKKEAIPLAPLLYVGFLFNLIGGM